MGWYVEVWVVGRGVHGGVVWDVVGNGGLVGRALLARIIVSWSSKHGHAVFTAPCHLYVAILALVHPFGDRTRRRPTG